MEEPTYGNLLADLAGLAITDANTQPASVASQAESVQPDGLTAHVEAEEENAAEVGIITFAVRVGAYTTKVVLTDVDSVPADDWAAIASGAVKMVTLCSSNGDVSVNGLGSSVVFAVSKYGAGGDGDMTLTVLHPAYQSAFAEVAKRVAEIHAHSAV